MKFNSFKIFALSMAFMLVSASTAYAGNQFEKCSTLKIYKTFKKTENEMKNKNPKANDPKAKETKIKVPETKKPKPVPVVKKPKEIKVTEISMNKTQTTIAAGSWERLLAFVKPTNAINKHILWFSTRPDIASVNPSGKVTGIKSGVAVIYAISRNDLNKMASCTVTVEQNTPTPPTVGEPASVTSVTINKTTSYVALKPGSHRHLAVTVAPESASDKSVTWSSGDTSVAVVDQSGKVTAVSRGTALITVTTADGGKTDQCLIKVIPESEWVEVTKVKINLLYTTMPVGEKDNLNYSLEPSDASNQEVVWTSSNTNIASVTTSGTIEAKSTGTAVITATSADGSKKASCIVTVIQSVQKPAQGILFNKITSTLLVNMSDYPVVNVYPSGTSISSLTWSTSDSSVATVSQSGKVTGVSPGYAVITVRTSDIQSASYVIAVVAQ